MREVCSRVDSLFRASLLFPTLLAPCLVIGLHSAGPPPCPTAVSVAVTPDASPVSRAEQTTGHTATFTVQNTGTCNDTYNFTYTTIGPISGVTLNKTSASVQIGNNTTVIATYNVGTPGTGVLKLRATGVTQGSNGIAKDSGWFNVTVVAVPLPLVSMTPYNFDDRERSRCAASCFTASYSQSTIPYFSLDAPRGVTLVYNGDRVVPKPFIHADVRHGGSSGDLPTAYRLQVKKADQTLVTFLNTEQTLRFVPSMDTLRLAGQFDAAANGLGATGVYPITLVVGGEYAPGVQDVLTTTKLTIVNDPDSAIAHGWALAGVQRLFKQGDGSALIIEGGGSAIYFAKSGSVWTTPLGDFSTLISGTPSGGQGWTRRYPDSTKIAFDTTGRMIEMRDRFNNTVTVTYDGSGRVWQIKDPLNLAITLTYDANGLTSIQDPNGRVTDVVVNASKRLTRITDPDNDSTTFGYDGSGRLQTIKNRRGHTTTLAYDAQSGLLSSITAPSVELVSADGSVTTGAPVTSFVPWQKQGVPYGLTGTPFTAPRADMVYARVTDPGGHGVRFTVNRWGTPAVAIDTLGRTDSTRFDGSGLPIRARSPAGAVDSAVYAPSGLPTYKKSAGLPATRIQYTAWAQPDSIWTDDGLSGSRYFIGANGRVDSVRVRGGTPDSAKTRIRYDSRGRPDSVVDPVGHLVQRTWYAGTNGNRSRDSLPGGRVTTYGHDAYGRDTSLSRPGLATTRIFYSIINRPDSVRDGVNPVATRYAYDNLLLTTVTDPKGQVYGFTYNAVGWLTQRTDPVNHSDTYKYSRDGELRRWTNRRGQTIEYAYDVFHRATNKSGTNTATESWAYPSDTVVVATSPVAVDTVLANRLGQLLRASTVMAGQLYVRRYTYTTAGALDSVIPSGGGIAFQARKYVWNLGRGTLTAIKLGLSPDSTRVAYTADGLLASVTLPGGDQITRSHSPLHTTAGIATTATYSATVNRSSGFDAANRIQRHITSPTTGHQFNYDSLGRLRGDSTIQTSGTPCDPHNPPDPNGDPCVFNPSWTVTGGVAFSYDSAGNRRDLGGSYQRLRM